MWKKLAEVASDYAEGMPPHHHSEQLSKNISLLHLNFLFTSFSFVLEIPFHTIYLSSGSIFGSIYLTKDSHTYG